MQPKYLLLQLSEEQIRNLEIQSFLQIEIELKLSSSKEEVIDTETALRILHISKPTLYKYIHSGLLKPTKIGRKYLFRKTEIYSLFSTK